MDTQISFALMSKAKAIFESDDTCLAFPITPLAYDKQQLNFFSDNPAQDVSHLLEFSELVDRIPDGPIWGTSNDATLSNIYREVLRDARLATSARTAEEEAVYQKARKLLYVEDADGLRHETPLYLAYQQCRDAYIRASEDYNNSRLTAEHSPEAAVKQQWTGRDEPLLRANVDAALERWNEEGQRSAVEQAKTTIGGISAKDPSLTWSQWQSHCNPELDFQTDPATNQTFAPTVFSPANALDAGSWQHFTLVAGEIETFARQAAPELRARLGGNVVNVDVESVSFEYSSAGLTRSWFTSDVFRSRFWRLDEPKVLSDGNTPPHGSCPAYIAGVVFARNLDVKLRAGSPANEDTTKRVVAGERFNVASFGILETRKPAFNEVILDTFPVSNRGVTAPLAAASAPTKVVNKLEVRSTAMPRAAVRPMAFGTVAQTSATTARPVVSELKAHDPAPPSRSFVALRNNFNRAPVAASPVLGRPIAKPADSDDNHIMILAFICKRLPRCPDPDPALQW